MMFTKGDLRTYGRGKGCMTFKNFMYKGILMIAVLALIGWLGKYLYLIDGEIDWFRLMLVYGVPVGSHICLLSFLQDGIYQEYLDDGTVRDCWKFDR